jgi:subtilisin family serine protease
MATPHVAGAAALVYANGVTDPDAVYKVLTKSATDLGARGWDTTYGYGLVNPVAALEMRNPRRAEGKAKGKGKAADGDELEIANVHVKNLGDSRAMISWTTSEPAFSAVNGSNGFERRDDTLTRMHRVAVRGKAGSTVEFMISSRHGRDDKDRQKVEVSF